MADKARNTGDFDVVIVGAGPAGLSAGIWCADLGLSAVILEKEPEPGGQLSRIYNPILNYPGVTASNGRELRDRFMESAKQVGVSTILSADIVEFDSLERVAIDKNGNRYSGEYFVFATGVSRRKLNVPGEDVFFGKGILESGAGQKESVRGKIVAIVGGGDAALENAIILSDFAKKIYLIHRRENLKGREMFARKVYENPKIELVLKSEVRALEGEEIVTSLKISGSDGRTKDLGVDAVLVRIGVEPNNGLLADQVRLDENGYILVDQNCQTSEPKIFAVGDVANPMSPTITTAVGMASTAAKTIRALSNKQKTL